MIERGLDTAEGEDEADEGADARARRRARQLEDRLRARTAHVGVVGLGSVGLPLSATFARAGFRVLGHDRDAARIAAVQRGERVMHHFPADLVPDLAASGRFEATLDAERLGEVDAVCVCVPTPLGPAREPDLGCVEAAALTLSRTLAPGVLVVLESTTYPGTTRDVLGGIFAAAGRRPGRDVWLAYSPEREDPGRTDWTTRTTPKLVGGTCARSGALVEALYGAAVERVHRVERAEVAEAAKLFENVYRAVNIALVNETKVALEAMGLDAWDVLDAAATKPFGFQRFTPGPGMGGHCIPIDPFYLAWAARRAGAATRLVEESGRINTELPGHVVERTRRSLSSRGVELAGARVLVLGLAYKAGVDLCFESPSLALLDRFAEAGAREVRWSDPLVASWPGRGASLELGRDVVAGFDAVVLATDQPGFDRPAIAREARLLVDTRNAFGDLLRGDPRYVRA